MTEVAEQVAQCVEVAVFAPLAGTYTYRWPADLGTPTIGIRLQVPFGRSMRFGLLVALSENHNEITALKPVHDRLDAAPLLDVRRLAWLERVRRYYLAQPGDLWNSALGWAQPHDVRRFRPVADAIFVDRFAPLAGLFKTRTALTLKTILQRLSNTAGARYLIDAACRAGLLEEVVPPARWASDDDAAQIQSSNAITPNADQQRAIAAVLARRDTFAPFLLFGCTGSGKTEVYLRAAAEVVAAERQVLVLVPEIGLTPLWLARLQQRFARVAIWHSAMTPKERLVVRSHLAETQILIGTRSALFLPLPRLGMIVVDEEHDASFKQQDGICYSARDMAVLLAQELKLPILLGSATPSLESWRQVRKGRYQRLDLPQQAVGVQSDIRAGIQSEIVDMRQIHEPVSPRLLAAMQANLEAGEQTILFLNRRGYAPALQCTACGDVLVCHDCSMRLTLHRRAGQLRCHSCGYRRRVPKSCEACGEAALLPLGEGTEKLDEWLTAQLPTLRFARFDRDIITSHARLEQTLNDFAAGHIDCLIGTQMLVKGHDFPNVTLVGVINADLGINLPDFRAGERWWQQMTQVTGRAGRGDKPGRVIIQTRMPEADWFHRIHAASAEATLDEELQLREMLAFPPYGRWVRLVLSARKLERVTTVAAQLANAIRRQPALNDIEMSGPMPCPMERQAGHYRFELLLRDCTRALLPWQLEPLLSQRTIPRDVRLRVDVDPLEMM